MTLVSTSSSGALDPHLAGLDREDRPSRAPDSRFFSRSRRSDIDRCAGKRIVLERRPHTARRAPGLQNVAQVLAPKIGFERLRPGSHRASRRTATRQHCAARPVVPCLSARGQSLDTIADSSPAARRAAPEANGPSRHLVLRIEAGLACCCACRSSVSEAEKLL